MDLWVIMVGWVDAQDSDQGDFRHQHAADISGLTWTKNLLKMSEFDPNSELTVNIDRWT